MTTNTTAQEIAEYRETIKALLETIELLLNNQFDASARIESDRIAAEAARVVEALERDQRIKDESAAAAEARAVQAIADTKAAEQAKAQEIAEYRETIKALLDTIEFMEGGHIPPELLNIMTKSAHWSLDKYSKNQPSTEIQGELL